MTKRFCVTFIICISLFAMTLPCCHSAEKPTLMMAELKAIDVSENEAAILSNALLSELIRTGKFQAVERKNIQELLKEMSLSLSDLMSSEAPAPEPGQFQAAQVACLGTVGKIGQTYVLQARCADVETGKLMGSTSLRCNGSIDCLLELTHQAASELSGLSLKNQSHSYSHQSSDSVTDQSKYSIITNSQFREFVDSGGYRNKKCWSNDGWQFILTHHINQPAFWTNPNLNLPARPVTGISWYEAEAYCNWKRCNLPSPDQVLRLIEAKKISIPFNGFFWTSEPSEMGFDCVTIIKNGRRSFSQKDLRNSETIIATGEFR